MVRKARQFAADSAEATSGRPANRAGGPRRPRSGRGVRPRRRNSCRTSAFRALLRTEDRELDAIALVPPRRAAPRRPYCRGGSPPSAPPRAGRPGGRPSDGASCREPSGQCRGPSGSCRPVAPFFAGRLALSTLARDQPIRSAAPRRSRRRRWSQCQTPAAPQSRSRRQQVIPLPQPNSCGRSPQGIPPRAHRGSPPAPRDPARAGGPTWPRRLRRQQRPDRRPQVVHHHVMRAHARRSRHGCVSACQTY